MASATSSGSMKRPIGMRFNSGSDLAGSLQAFAAIGAALRRLAGLRSSPQLRSMQRIGRERLDAFIPRLLAQAVEHDNPDLVLERVLPLVEAVARLHGGTLALADAAPGLAATITLRRASDGADRVRPAPSSGPTAGSTPPDRKSAAR